MLRFGKGDASVGPIHLEHAVPIEETPVKDRHACVVAIDDLAVDCDLSDGHGSTLQLCE